MALAAIEAQRCRTIFNDSPQKSLGPVTWLFPLYPLPDTRTTPYALCRFEAIRHLLLKPPPRYSASAMAALTQRLPMRSTRSSIACSPATRSSPSPRSPELQESPPGLIHNTYPAAVERIRSIMGMSVRAQRDSKHRALMKEKELNKAHRAENSQFLEEIARLASVNQRLMLELAQLKGVAQGKVIELAPRPGAN